jgi:hypothetical protein
MSEQFESRWASSRKMLFAGSTAAALAAALLAGAPAFAGTPAVAPIGAVVLTDDPTDEPDPTDTDVWVPETPVDGKTTDGSESDVEPTAPAEPETPVQVPDGHGGYSIKYAITTNGGCLRPAKAGMFTPPNGSKGELRAQASTLVKLGYIPGWGVTNVKYTGNNSFGQWGGLKPYNADSIALTDEWDTDYNAISISISSSPSGSINHGSGRLTWKTTKNKVWKVVHQDDEVRMKVNGGVGVVTEVNYNIYGEFDFGSTTVRKSGYKSHRITTMFGVPDIWGC